MSHSFEYLAIWLKHVKVYTGVPCRVYSVSAPNCLWHIDGLHCLIRWRIVIHGGINGYSRRVVYLQASDNNRVNTVLSLFRQAVNECSWPSRVRSDRGGENVDVARVMLGVRGTGHRCHLAGSSVHSQRIERLWKDVFRCVCHYFYSMFYEMESPGILDPISDPDLYALHYVFILRLNSHLLQFMAAWNHHPLRTERGLSPLQLWQRGMLLLLHNGSRKFLMGSEYLQIMALTFVPISAILLITFQWLFQK